MNPGPGALDPSEITLYDDLMTNKHLWLSMLETAHICVETVIHIMF